MYISLADEKKQPAVFIYENGWYFVAKLVADNEDYKVYEIDKDVEYYGFGDLKDAVVYYKERITPK
jgi:hypothetical protein